ncbi:hypothetical protein ACP4OV_005122 [Aristida adscensionis]
MEPRHLFLPIEEFLKCRKFSRYPSSVDHAQVPGFLLQKKRASGKHIWVSSAHRIVAKEPRTDSAALITWLLRLHSTGQSLEGKFDWSDLRMDPLGNVKCKDSKRLHLKIANQKRKRLDFNTARGIIKTDILGIQSLSNLPKDLALLLDLMKRYRDGDELLIAHHPGLMTENEKISICIRVLAEFEILEQTDSNAHTDIIRKMRYGGGVWKDRAHTNVFLEGVYTYRNRQKTYSESPRGLIRFYRNSIHHLMKSHLTPAGVLIQAYRTYPWYSLPWYCGGTDGADASEVCSGSYLRMTQTSVSEKMD